METKMLLFLFPVFLSAAAAVELKQVVEMYSDDNACGPKLAIETPHCKLVEKKDGYELRKYPEGQIWVETVVANSSFTNARTVGFYRLFYFISGKNSRSEIIEMTAPVLTYPEKESHGYKISFFTPSKYKSVDDLPEPLDSNVKFHVAKEHTAAVAGPFGGFPSESDYQKRWREMKKKLEEDDDVSYDEESVCYVGYSSPFEFVNRKQEVHVIVSGHW